MPTKQIRCNHCKSRYWTDGKNGCPKCGNKNTPWQVMMVAYLWVAAIAGGLGYFLLHLVND